MQSSIAQPWHTIRERSEKGDVCQFVEGLRHHLQVERGSALGSLSDDLMEHCFSREHVIRALSFIDDVVHHQTHLNRVEKPFDALITHGILDCVPRLLTAFSAQLEQRHVRLRAARLFLGLLTPLRIRLAVKVAQGYRLTERDLWEARRPGQSMNDSGVREVQAGLAESIRGLLDSTKTLTSAVLLLMHFSDIGLVHFSPEKLMGRLIAQGQSRLAEEWAKSLGQSFQVKLVEECIARDNLSQACRSTRHFGLQEQFPTVERDYQEHVLARLIVRQQWQAALTACDNNEALQARLVRAMLLAGEASLAMEFSTMLRLPASVLQIEPSILAEQALHHSRTYLQLPVPRTSVHLVDTEEQALPAVAMLSNSTVLGVDCEWEPRFEASFGHGVDSSPTSILQVASRTEVMIFDLYKLNNSPILDKALTSILWDEHVLKLGCGVANDIRSAAKAYPHMAAFKQVRGVVDLRNLFSEHVQVTGLQLPRLCQGKGISLSMMTEACLGRPLDKSMQVSRWGRRPLSERQIQYAAMDALVSVLIFDFMKARSGQSYREQIRQSLHSIDTGPEDQTSTKDKQRHATSGPDQRLPKGQPEHGSSVSRGSVHQGINANQISCADGSCTGEACLPLRASSDIINPRSGYEARAFHCGPGSGSIGSTTISRGQSQISRITIPVQNRPFQPPSSPTQPGLADRTPD